MKRILISFALFFFVALFAYEAYAGDVPHKINYQGYVTSGGTAFSGTGYFKIMLADDGGTSRYWCNDDNTPSADPSTALSTIVSSGVFNIILGDGTAANQEILTSVFTDYSTVYLHVWFSTNNITFEKLSPNQQVVSSPYAYNAYEAYTVESATQAAVKLGPYHTDPGDTGEIRFLELVTNGTNYVGFKAPDLIGAANPIWTLPSTDGANGQALSTNGSGILSWTSVGIGDITAVGSVASGDAFNSPDTANGKWLGIGETAGRIGFTDGVTDYVNILGANVGIGTTAPEVTLDVNGDERLMAQGDLRFADSDSTNYVAFQGPATVLSNVTWTLPSADGSSGDVLKTDGSAGLSWTTPTSGTVKGTGTATYIPKWSAADTLASSIIYDDGSSHIGIGTTSPGTYTKLNISQTDATASQTRYGLYSTATGAGTTSTNVAGYFSATGGTTANYGLIVASGNVGIGTTTPNNTLQVAGLINFNDTIYGTFLGYQAGNVSTGAYNTAVGYQALAVNTSGNNNTAVGYQALAAVITGAQSTAVGIQALSKNTSDYNTAVGGGALQLSIAGSKNTAIGRMALNNNTNSSNNTALGYNALRYSETGANNTAVGLGAGNGYAISLSSFSNSSLFGYNSGFSLTTGGNNILIGYHGDLQTYALTTGSNNIVIGYNIDLPAVDSSNMLNIGNLIYATGVNGTGTTLSTGNVGIGTTAPSVALEVGSNTAGQNAKISATLGTELITAPMQTAGWTLGYDTGGWTINDGTGALTKTASTATVTATAVSGMTSAPTIGVTYKVVIVCSAVSGAPTYTFGGVTGSTITATTITNYITASSTAKIIFSGTAAVTATITSVSITALTDAKGDLTVEGNLKLGSPIQSANGTNAITINPNGYVGIGTVPGYTLDVLGNIYSSSSMYSTWFQGTYFRASGADSEIIIQDRGFTSTHTAINMGGGTITNSTGQFNSVAIKPVYNQTGNASATDLLVNRTQTTVGSGAQLLMDLQVASTSKFKVDNTGKPTIDSTVTPAGTTGNQTINKPSGTVNFAAAATSLTVTNSTVTANSIVLCTVRTNDATAQIKNVVPSAGSFTITLSAAATAETSVGFVVIN